VATETTSTRSATPRAASRSFSTCSARTASSCSWTSGGSPFPGANPHFTAAALAESLAAARIAYQHERDLGGHREPRPGSPNTALRAAAFRGYADHMATPAFRAALARLEARAAAERAAFMCAEADPRHCHRQLLADALAARGARVLHILGPGRVEAHVLHPAARVTLDGTIVYRRP
jgi:uncharacterized protein (DUF488 family)